MTAPKVSVIVPVYNTEKYLKQCIDSISSQTLSQIEIILVDDGSKEECALLCDELAQSDSRIKVIHKTNAGPGLARNTGMEASSGEYIGFVDSDDYVKPEMYEALYTSAVKYNADLVVSGICFVGGNTVSPEITQRNIILKKILCLKTKIGRIFFLVLSAHCRRNPKTADTE